MHSYIHSHRTPASEPGHRARVPGLNVTFADEQLSFWFVGGRTDGKGKANTDSPYFVTLTVVNWVDVFSRKEYADIIIENLKHCQKNEGLRIYAYVIMTNHLHLVVRREHEKPLGELLGRFKSNTSKQIIKAITVNKHESRKEWMLSMFMKSSENNKQYKKFHFWQYTSHPIELFSNTIIDQKIEYIHNNPVVAGIVTECHHYFYSSANPENDLQVDEA